MLASPGWLRQASRGLVRPRFALALVECIGLAWDGLDLAAQSCLACLPKCLEKCPAQAIVITHTRTHDVASAQHLVPRLYPLEPWFMFGRSAKEALQPPVAPL